MTEESAAHRLLFIAADKFPPFRVDVEALFGEKMVKRGYHIDWILQSAADCAKSYRTRWRSSDVWVGSTDNGTTRWRRASKHLRAVFNDARLFGLARHKQYDFIQVKDKFVAALFAIAASKLYGHRFVYWLSYPIAERYQSRVREGNARYPWIYRILGKLSTFVLYRIILPSADYIFVQSERMKFDVVSQGIDSEKITAIPMGVILERIPYDPILTRKSDPNASKRVVYLGTLSRVRKLDFVITAFSMVTQILPDARLYMVGRGEDELDEKILREAAARLDVADKVIFTGFLPMAEAWDYVRDALVCISPFYPTPILNSTSPTKLIEYMAMGKPVVVNDHPEQQKVVSESGCGICVRYDEVAFADAIIKLLNDPVEARNMGRKGRIYVERYRTYEYIADVVDERYRQLLSH